MTDASLVARIVATFAILVMGFFGVTTPALAHRISTGMWHAAPGKAKQRKGVNDESAADTELGLYGDEESNGARAGVASPATTAAVAAVVDTTPRPRRFLTYMHVVKLLSATGCGAIIMTATVHIAPDAHDNLQNMLEGNYPYAMLIMSSVVLFMYVVEHELTLVLQRRMHRQAAEQARVRAAATAGAIALGDDCHGGYVEEDNCDESKRIRSSVATHVLEVGVAVHSIIVGFAMGMIRKPTQARNLGIALCFHQFCEGAAIGAAVLESQLTPRHSAVMWAIFAFTAPSGILLGIAVEQTQGHEQSWKMLLSQGILESIACGILLFMSLVDMLPNLFCLPAHEDVDDEHDADLPDGARHSGCGAKATALTGGADEELLSPRSREAKTTEAVEQMHPEPPLWYRLMMYACLATGAGVMALLGKWA